MEDEIFEAIDAKIEKFFSVDDIIDLLVDGKSDRQILEIAKERGFKLVKNRIEDTRWRYKNRIAELAFARAKELLKRVPSANKATRIKDIDILIKKMTAVVNVNLNEGRVNNTDVRVIDLILKAYRQIAEETNDINPVIQQTNQYINILNQMPEEQRSKMMDQIKEMKEMMEAGVATDVGKQEPIDVEFTPEE